MWENRDLTDKDHMYFLDQYIMFILNYFCKPLSIVRQFVWGLYIYIATRLPWYLGEGVSVLVKMPYCSFYSVRIL